MLLKKIFRKTVSHSLLFIAVCLRPFYQRGYDKINTKRLAWLGVNISSEDGYFSFISPTAFIDGTDYSLITIGKRTVISNDVILLTHDASIKQGLRAIGTDIPLGKNVTFLKPIVIGDNCFLGIRSVLLPNTHLGNNTIVAAGAVVAGKTYPDNVLLAGVPAKIIGNTTEWARKHKESCDYLGS